MKIQIPARKPRVAPRDPAAFLDALKAGVIVRRVTPGQRERITISAGRHVHVVTDQANYAIDVDRHPARRDPLVAALFGAA